MKLMLDTQNTEFRVSRAAEEKTERETGVQRKDRRTGEPLWLVQLVAEDDDGAEVIRVTVASEHKPKLTRQQAASVEGLEAIPWSQGERSGVAYRAQSITQQPASKPAAAAA